MENSFGTAALQTEESAKKYIKMLMDDSEKSRRNQGTFILNKLPDAPGDLARLKEATDAIDKRLQLLSPKGVAELGPMLPQYLGYQRLSDDSAHATARALQHHVALHTDGANKHWTYRFELGTDDEISATVHYALLAALAVGIGVTHQVKADTANANLHLRAQQWQSMPSIKTI